MAKAQVVKWGNSLAVRIPKPLAERAGFSEGDPLVMEPTEGQIRLRRANRVPTLRELVAQITPENRYGEIPTGRARDKEAVEW